MNRTSKRHQVQDTVCKQVDDDAFKALRDAVMNPLWAAPLSGQKLTAGVIRHEVQGAVWLDVGVTVCEATRQQSYGAQAGV